VFVQAVDSCSDKGSDNSISGVITSAICVAWLPQQSLIKREIATPQAERLRLLMTCHACVGRHPERLALLDSALPRNDGEMSIPDRRAPWRVELLATTVKG